MGNKKFSRALTSISGKASYILSALLATTTIASASPPIQEMTQTASGFATAVGDITIGVYIVLVIIFIIGIPLYFAWHSFQNAKKTQQQDGSNPNIQALIGGVKGIVIGILGSLFITWGMSKLIPHFRTTVGSFISNSLGKS